jgi:hypothetical protein
MPLHWNNYCMHGSWFGEIIVCMAVGLEKFAIGLDNLLCQFAAILILLLGLLHICSLFLLKLHFYD